MKMRKEHSHPWVGSAVCVIGVGIPVLPILLLGEQPDRLLIAFGTGVAIVGLAFAAPVRFMALVDTARESLPVLQDPDEE